ncbi:MAG: biosynthetic-type acetolactate synthase large subunit [Chloroflexota bacterium]
MTVAAEKAEEKTKTPEPVDRPRIGARLLCEALIREGAEVIFGYPGGVVIPLYDVFPEYPQLHHVLVRHEQGAGHAADGYARVTGKAGVCLATSGPGATNLVTAIATAKLDSVPMVAITGQVPQNVIGSDAFQETDIMGVTIPITKHNFLIRSVDEIGPIIQQAFHLAQTGRPGPVLVDIPKDVLLAVGELQERGEIDMPGYRPTYRPHHRQIRLAVQEIEKARRPLILAGHGALISGATDALTHFAEKTQVPVGLTLLGIGGFPTDHPLCLGMVGMHGFTHANRAINEADLLIAVGMRFDDRVTGKLSEFAPNAEVIHIDIDPAEIGKNVPATVPVVADAKIALQMLSEAIEPQEHAEWLDEINEWRQRTPRVRAAQKSGLAAQTVVERLSDLTPDDAIITTDVGQHQMWAAQFYKAKQPNTWVSSGGLGTMGFGVPSAMGAALARPEAEIWAIVGDGGVQMTAFEFSTLVQERANVKIAILNNGFLGMVRQWQQFFHNSNYSETQIGQPDFVALAHAHYIAARRVDSPDEVDDAIRWAQEIDGPVLIDFVIGQEDNVFPMIPSGATFADLIEGE